MTRSNTKRRLKVERETDASGDRGIRFHKRSVVKLELAPSTTRMVRKLGSASKWAATWTPRFPSVLRIVAGLLFLEYGLSKLFGFPHVTMFDGIHPFQPLWFAGIIELVGGALVTVGLFTRAAAFIMSGEMAVGYLSVHAPKSFFRRAKWR
jgi:uncharacterized membrane protein YphA (DoxX/SURF4 family)